MAASRAAWEIPTAEMEALARAKFNESNGSPWLFSLGRSRFSLGTRQASKISSAVGKDLTPNLWISREVKGDWDFSTNIWSGLCLPVEGSTIFRVTMA